MKRDWQRRRIAKNSVDPILSCQNILHHAAGDICQTKVAARVLISEFFVVQSHQIQDRCVQIIVKTLVYRLIGLQSPDRANADQ